MLTKRVWAVEIISEEVGKLGRIHPAAPLTCGESRGVFILTLLIDAVVIECLAARQR